jgi:uncharacterized membrane protein YhiD involved in acid resistance
MSEALAKVYEITAFLDIALLAALVTVYAIIVSLMGRMLAWVREKLQEIELRKGEAKGKFQKELDSVKGDDPQEAIKKLTEKWEKSKAELDKTEISFERRERLLSWSGVILFTGSLLVVSLILTLVAILIGKSSLLCSAGFYLGALVALLWALIRVSLTLKEATELAKETSPQEKQDLEKLFKEVFGLKKAEYEVFFEMDNKLVDTLNIKKEEEQRVRLVVDNDSRFAVKDTVVSLMLPEGFTLRKRIEDTPDAPRSATLKPYPGGADLSVEIQTLSSASRCTLSFLIKGENAGKFEMYVRVNSTTHERHRITLKVIVKK